jgi:hypothetical protein
MSEEEAEMGEIIAKEEVIMNQVKLIERVGHT